MPLLAVALARALALPSTTAAGLVLLGSVSGGQASNLCALLAGGDLALSVVLTVSTTVLGVVATPALVQLLLGATVAVDAAAMLGSIARLVLLPLAAGLAAGQYLPALVARLQPALPRLGIAALLGLVAGGSANAASLLLGAAAWRAHAASILLPLIGGAVALAIAAVARLDGARAHALDRDGDQKSNTRLCARADALRERRRRRRPRRLDGVARGDRRRRRERVAPPRSQVRLALINYNTRLPRSLCGSHGQFSGGIPRRGQFQFAEVNSQFAENAARRARPSFAAAYAA